MHRLVCHTQSRNIRGYVMNLDPAVMTLPFAANIDIRDTIRYKEVMKQFNLGPNGGILTSLNLFTTKFDEVTTYSGLNLTILYFIFSHEFLKQLIFCSSEDEAIHRFWILLNGLSSFNIVKSTDIVDKYLDQIIRLVHLFAYQIDHPVSCPSFIVSHVKFQVISLIERRADHLDYVLVDTPGQIEIFTWSASGAIITEAFASTFPTVVTYVVDTPRSANPMTFMSNMLYACSILYKTRLPLVLAFNKTDVAQHEFALEVQFFSMLDYYFCDYYLP